MAYDSDRDVFYALSDDQGQIDPVRFYTLRIDLADGASTQATSTSSPSRPFSSRTASLSRRRAPTRRAGADEGRRARRHLGGLCDQVDRSLRPPLRARRLVDSAISGPGAVPAERRRHPRRTPEPRLRERGHRAERPLPLHRHRGRTRPGRPAGDARGGQPRATAPLQPPDRSSTASTSTGPTRSPSRPCRRRTSRSTGSSSCSR